MLDKREYEEQINRCACEHYELLQLGKEASTLKKQLFFLIFQYLSDQKNYPINGKDVCRNLMVDSAAEILTIDKLKKLFDDHLEKWQPGRAEFFVYFLGDFKKRVINELKRSNKIDRDLYYENEEGEEESKLNKLPDKCFDSDTVVAVESRNDFTERYKHLNNVMLTTKHKYDNRTKPFYHIRYFTEYTTFLVSEFGKTKSAELIPSITIDILDKDFASTYLRTNGNPTIIKDFKDIAQAELRRLFDFTGDESDKNKLCGYKLDHSVFLSYMEKEGEKTVSDTRISQQRSNFRDDCLALAGLPPIDAYLKK